MNKPMYWKRSAILTQKRSQEEEKRWLHLRMSIMLFAVKHSWATLCISRPLFGGSYLQVKWLALGQ